MLTTAIVRAIGDLLGKGEDIVFATVLSKSGSAPCLAGAKMVLRSDGSSIGTVGGGALEAKAQAAGARLFESHTPEMLEFHLSGEDATSMQMICGGNVKVLLDFIPATPGNIEVFRDLGQAIATSERCYLVTSMGSAETEARQTDRCLVLEDGSLSGEFAYERVWLDALIKKAQRSNYAVIETIEGERFVVERCFIPSTVFVCGAGHVGAKVAQLAEMVEFRTVVIDDRAVLANRDTFPDAFGIKVCESFEGCLAGFDLDGDSYIVIVTRGHEYDKTVLAQALRTQAGYIGMMGSHAKRKEIFGALEREGFTADDLARVHTPIGLAIKASTPAEIAVSIVAELILTRAQPVE
jgi:xanthine dehydrogenase accessory factor